MKWFVFAVCALLPWNATAQLPVSDECGAAPNRNLNYSRDIRNVAATLAQKNTATKIDSGAKIIYQGTPIEGFLNIDRRNDELLKSDLSQVDVMSFVQKELAEHRTAIVAECMYYFWAPLPKVSHDVRS